MKDSSRANVDSRSVLYEKTGGFMKGICHPTPEFSRITEAGIQWIRRDVPSPFGNNGDLSEHYKFFLNETREYAKNGIRSVLVSPYPHVFIENGIDPRTKEGLEKVTHFCALIAKDFSGIGACWQATNEMHIAHFRSPLTMAESRDYIIASIKGLREGDPDAAIGHNSVCGAPEWLDYARYVESEVHSDYIGFDLYNGTWSNGGPETYIDEIELLYREIGLPVVLMEFGFSSLGINLNENSPEIDEYLSKRGFRDRADVCDRLDEFIETLPPGLKEKALTCAPEDKANVVFSTFPHLLKCWFAEQVYPHTEEGQAHFYSVLLPMLLENPHLAGTVIYCWRDSHHCFFCGEPDCPCETAWGLTRCDGTEKPAYDIIKSIFTA